MIISCIGDSLTEGDYGVFGKSGIANVQGKNYPHFLASILGATTRNFGKCGYRVNHIVNYYEQGNIDVHGSDYIVIMLGTNGGIHPSDFTSFENVCYKKLISLCRKDAPTAKIVLCTPPHATRNPAYSNCGYADQVQDAVEYVRTLAKEENLPVIEVALCPFFTAENEKIMQPNDGLHFSEIGYQKLAEYIAHGLKELF